MKSNTPLKFFVVENHQDTLDAIKMFLESQGHTVIAAPDMKSALKLAPKAEFDILISDIGLPDGSGLELMRSLVDRPIRGIALSGFGMEEDIARSKDAGFSEHLIKPVSFQSLQETIGRVLG